MCERGRGKEEYNCLLSFLSSLLEVSGLGTAKWTHVACMRARPLRRSHRGHESSLSGLVSVRVRGFLENELHHSKYTERFTEFH